MNEIKDRREVFFALIAPIGVDLDVVEKALERSLKIVGYDANGIRLTQIFDDVDHCYDVIFKKRIRTLRKANRCW